jgi:hypothetical protein
MYSLLWATGCNCTATVFTGIACIPAAAWGAFCEPCWHPITTRLKSNVLLAQKMRFKIGTPYSAPRLFGLMEYEMQHLWYNPAAAGSCDLASNHGIFLQRNFRLCMAYGMRQTSRLSQKVFAPTPALLPPGPLRCRMTALCPAIGFRIDNRPMTTVN